MKTTVLRLPLLLAASLLTLGAAHAQQAVPNGAFETWITRNGGDAPGQWLTTDDLARELAPVPLPPTSAVTKSTDSRTGGFAARMTTVATFIGTAPGIILLGNRLGDIIASDSLDELGGLPYTSRPARMQFYYKFSGTIATPEDRPVASVLLTKTTGGVRQVVARGKRYLTATATAYALVDLPLTYQAGFAPDSIHIAFGSADFNELGTNYTIGNTLFVDDVAMVGTVAATRDPQLQAAVRVFPNPSASGRFTLDASREPALLAAPLTVTDALGRVVLRQSAAPAAGPRVVDLSQRTAGVYSLRLDTERGPVVHQLLIQ